MSNNKREKISPEVMGKAKDLYMQYQPVAQIARELEIPRSTVTYWESKGWKDERELKAVEQLSTMTSIHITTLSSMTKNALKAAERSLAHIAERDMPATTKELTDIWKILEGLHNLKERYEKDNKTEQGNDDEEYDDPFSN